MFVFVQCNTQNSHDCGELLDEEYLEGIERNFKTYFLPLIGKHAELFTYKLNQPVTEENATELSELIVDELSQSDMDEYFMSITCDDEKFGDWRFFDSDERLNKLRRTVTYNKYEVLQYFEVYPYYVDELYPAHSLLMARAFVTDRALRRRMDKIKAQRSLKQKIFGRKRPFDEIDQKSWLIKTGFPPDDIQAA